MAKAVIRKRIVMLTLNTDEQGWSGQGRVGGVHYDLHLAVVLIIAPQAFVGRETINPSHRASAAPEPPDYLP